MVMMIATATLASTTGLVFFADAIGCDSWDSCVSCHRPGLREEFEMDNRFRNIEFKLNMLQQNTNFFIEMLHNQKR